MRKLNPVLEEILIFPAHLIWLGWRVLGESYEDSSFLQIWKSTNDAFRAELTKGSRFVFALIGSIGIYALVVQRIINILKSV